MKRLFLILVALVIVYIGSYAWFRSSHVERWNQDGRDYVIFPQQPALYYLYRRSRISTRSSQGCVFTSGHIDHDATPTIYPIDEATVPQIESSPASLLRHPAVAYLCLIKRLRPVETS